MNHYISNDVVITEKELINEIINLKEKIRDLEIEKRNQRKIIDLFNSFYPQIKQPLLLTDIEGKIIFANEEFIELLGYTLFDLKRMTIRSITPMKLHQHEQGVLTEELNVTKKIAGRFSEFIKINGECIKVEQYIIAVIDDRNKIDGIARFVKNIL